MYEFPHAGRIAQDVLIERLAMHGYHQTGTIFLLRHDTNGVAFTLVVDDFGVKFKDPAAAVDLVRCLQLYYTLTVKKNATKFLGLTIAVDPIAREVRLSAPGAIPKALHGSPHTLPPSISLLLASELPLRLLTIPTPLLCLLLKNITAYRRCSAEFIILLPRHRLNRFTCRHRYRIHPRSRHSTHATGCRPTARLLSQLP